AVPRGTVFSTRTLPDPIVTAHSRDQVNYWKLEVILQLLARPAARHQFAICSPMTTTPFKSDFSPARASLYLPFSCQEHQGIRPRVFITAAPASPVAGEPRGRPLG